MVRAIGFRCTPHKVYYAIIESNDSINSVLDVDCINIPKCLIVPEKLKFIRNNIIDIINEYSITKAGIRAIEPSSQQKSIDRIHYEGVIQELFASSCLSEYYVGYISNISKKINIQRNHFKEIISNRMEFTQIDNFRSHTVEEKEALLTSLGALSNV